MERRTIHRQINLQRIQPDDPDDQPDDPDDQPDDALVGGGPGEPEAEPREHRLTPRPHPSHTGGKLLSIHLHIFFISSKAFLPKCWNALSLDHKNTISHSSFKKYIREDLLTNTMSLLVLTINVLPV